MKKLFIIVAALFISLAATAQSRTEKIEFVESSARNIEPTQSVVVSPLIADLKIISNERISYSETSYAVVPEIERVMPSLKGMALSNAAKKYNADAIVAATIDVRTNEAGFLVITVSGYPAKYDNFRNATSDDLDLVLKAHRLNDKSENTDVIATPENRMRIINKM